MAYTPYVISRNVMLIEFLKYVEEHYIDYEEPETKELTKHIINGYIIYKLS